MKGFWRGLMLLLTLCFCHGVSANSVTLQELQQQGLVSIKSSIEPQGSAAIGQQLRLQIEVGTSTFFKGGTRIGLFELADAVVLRRSKLASNFTERKAGVTWSKQLWEIVIYPQRSGRYVVPPIAIAITVSGPERQNVSGTILTEPLQFSAQLPDPTLTQDSQWFVASSAQLEQQFSVASDSELKVGEALIHEVTLTVGDSTAMLLPVLSVPQELGQVARLYPDPEQLQDKQNRGDYSAERRDKHTYVLQAGGQLVIPERHYQWWQPETQQLHQLTVAGGQWTVKHTPLSWLKAYWPWLTGAMVLLIVLIWLVILLRRRLAQRKLPLSWLWRRALWQRNWPEANRLLYQRRYQQSGQAQLRGGLVGNDTERVYQRWSHNHYQAQDQADAGSIIALWRRLRRSSRWQLAKALPVLEKDRE